MVLLYLYPAASSHAKPNGITLSNLGVTVHFLKMRTIALLVVFIFLCRLSANKGKLGRILALDYKLCCYETIASYFF